MIESRTSKQIKNLIALQNKSKLRNEQKLFVVEGTRICKEVPNDMLVKTYISQSFYEQLNLGKLDYDLKGEYEIVADKIFDEVSMTKTPQGVLTVVKQPSFSFEDIIGLGNKTLMFLEDVRDPGNLGTIIRTAEGANIDGIVMSKGTVDIFNPKVIRSTMGAIYRMPFVYVEDFSEAILKAKETGIAFYAAHLKGDSDYALIEYNHRSAVIIGNEANGITDNVSELADKLVKIPMTGSVESLNASIAAAVFMYEIYRQRRILS